MNKKQKIVLWVGIISIILMILFPPYQVSGRLQGAIVQTYDGHKFIFSTPFAGKLPLKIDFPRLYLQFAAIGLLTFGLFVTFKQYP